MIQPLSLLNLVVEGTGNYLVLLFLGKLDKVYRVAAYSYGKLGVLLRMSLSVKKCLLGKYVYVKVVSALLYVAVKKIYKIIYLILCCCHFKFLL